MDAADGIGDPGAGTCGTEQPAEIGSGPASHRMARCQHQNDHSGGHVGGCFRDDFKSLYLLFAEFTGERETNLYAWRNKKDTLLKVVLPGTVPNILSIMKVNIGLCLVGVVIGEFIGARRGLGYLIIYGSQVFKLDWVLMSIVILCVIAMLLYALLGRLEAACLKRL